MAFPRRLPRRATLLAGVLAVAVAASACGSAGPSGTPRPAGPTTTAPAACPSFGSTTDASGGSRVDRTPAVALLGNVQVQASSCVDEVAFSFMGGIPGWSAGYRAGPLTEDPSGRAAEVAGAAHLVIRFDPAAGVDLASDHPVVTYDGPADLRPASPSGVAEVRRLGDFESVTTWALGLADRRPFQVTARGEQLVVRLPAVAPRVTRCASQHPGLSVGYPSGWYAELSDRWACRYFDPAPFVVHPATDDFSWAVTVQLTDVPASEAVARLTSGPPPAPTVHARTTSVAGLPATAVDVTESGQGMNPAGYQYRVYVVDSGAQALMIQGRSGPRGAQADAVRSAVDQIAGLIAKT